MLAACHFGWVRWRVVLPALDRYVRASGKRDAQKGLSKKKRNNDIARGTKRMNGNKDEVVDRWMFRGESRSKIDGSSGAAKVEDRPLKPAEHSGLARMLPRCGGFLFLQVPVYAIN